MTDEAALQNVERISACVQMHHPQYSNKTIKQHLDACTENGTIQKVRVRDIISRVQTRPVGMRKFFLVAAKPTT